MNHRDPAQSSAETPEKFAAIQQPQILSAQWQGRL